MDVLPVATVPSVAAEHDGEVYVFPASYAQRRLWFLDRLQPGSAAYNLPAGLRLAGPLLAEVLRRTLAEIVARHESLRTTFAMIDGEPMQVIDPAARIEMPLVDLDALGSAEREGELARLFAEESRRPFDLARGPLLRTLLVRLAGREHAILFNLHHIVGDGWSMGVLVREVGALYAAFDRGLPSPLPDLPLQYADFAQAQLDWLQGEVLEEQLSYWRRQLAGIAPLELPADHPRPAERRSRGGSRSTTLSPELTGELARLSRQQGTTLFVVLLAALKTLLHRYTGGEDVSVGTAVAGRNHLDTEGMIGFFVNTLVLRTRLGGVSSFLDLVGRVDAIAVEAYTHQDVPFEKLVDELRPSRDLARTPFFDVMLTLQNTPPATLELPGLELDPMPPQEGTAKFDWSWNAVETAEGLLVQLDYSADLFEGETIERCLGHWRRLLEAIAEEPGRSFTDLPMLTGAEQREVLSWGRGEGVEIPAASLPELFARQVRQSPGAPAVVSGETVWTYEELDGWARRISRHLARLGIGPERTVALLLDRSPEAVAALLGVLGAGGAYLPLDSSHPRERLDFLLRDSGAALVLTDGRHRDELPESVPVVLLEDIEGEQEAPAPLIHSRPHPRSLAYVLYTSGSTGLPKGVMIEHASLVNYLSWVNRELPRVELPAITRLSFDASLKQILAPLLRGGTVWLPAVDALEDPAELLRELERRSGVGLNCVPSLWRALLERIESGRSFLPSGSLAALLLGGEAIERGLLERTRAAVPGIEVWNLYGPTEVTANATAGRPGTGSRVTLGEPVSNTRVHLLDGLLRPVPAGVPGEIHVAGEGLARGYRGRPDLTAERFVPDPFAAEPGGRLYRTGDRARWLPDGGLEFLGRIDQQVKLRGFRIEPGEIEAALAGHPGVTEAAVAVQGGGEEARLVGYVVPRQQPGPAESELREICRRRLPAYMVPSAFVVLPEMPRTVTGKIDRAALPSPRRAETEALPGAPAAVPVTATEELLLALWQAVLEVDGARVHDDFFELGGHSLLAIRLLSRVRDTWGVEIPVRVLFERPTVTGLSRAIDERVRAGGRASAPPISPLPRHRALPLSFAQQRLWLIDQLDPESPLYNIPLALRVEGALSLAVLARSLEEVVRRHEALRTVFVESDGADGAPSQVVLPAGPAGRLPLPVADLGALPALARETEARKLAAEEAARPFSLGRGPLLRASVARLGPADHIVMLTLHHIVSDGWSTGVLTREMVTLYEAFASRRPSPLPELRIQYGDFAAWQRQWLTPDVLETELAYWRDKLAGAPPLLELPADRSRPAVQTYHGRSRQVRLSRESTQAVLSLGRQSGATPFMVLLAGFQAVLSRWAGQRDISVGTPVAGRDYLEIEDLIGFFVNTLVLRSDLSGDPTFAELLARVRATTMEAYSHQQVPFERLVEELARERSLRHSPLFQVMFALQNTPVRSLEVEGLAFRPWGNVSSAAKFDLSLDFQEIEGRLAGYLQYNTDLFDDSTAERLSGFFVRLTEAAVAQPGRLVSELPFLGEAERAQVMVQWNDTAVAHEFEICLHELFRLQAKRSPDAVAVSRDDRSLSYAELDARSNQLASRLIDLGVGPEVRVGIFMERSIELVVGLLGVLKAGGAYVPLEPDYPRERLAAMLEDSGAAVVLTQEPLLSSLPERSPAVLVLDPDLRLLDGVPEQAPPCAAMPANIAYVLFTSGSTGRPKGVMIQHAAISHHMLWMLSAYPLGQGDCVLQKTATSFDASVWEFYAPLLSGARLAIAPSGEQREPARLVERLLSDRVTVLQVVPTLLQMLLQEPGFATCRGLRYLYCGGEPLTEELRQSFVDLLPATLVNVYGPTETAINASSQAFPPATTVSIGRPIHNARLYIVDEDQEPVALRVPGELLVGGRGLGRGYLGRPDLTAERFVPDPWGGPGERLYRTGDLCRYRTTGEIEFLGRLDHQVKLRGVRIELGEIEAALRAEGVRDAVVLVREDSPGDHRLVAYVVAREGAPSLPEIREALRRRLPDAMVPSSWVALDSLPLTPNGKVDRKALPAPETAAEEADYLTPAAPGQQIVAAIFADVLGLERVGLRGSFFNLGGHSLLATRVVARLREAFGLELPLRVLFEEPTVEGLAGRIERELQAGDSPLPPLSPAHRDGAMPLSFAQQRLWFLDQLEPGSSLYNIPLTLRIEGDLDAVVLVQGLEEVVRRHEALRTVFVAAAGSPAQVVLPAGRFPLPVVDLGALSTPERESEARKLAMEEVARPFDLQRGPLLRAGLLQVRGEADAPEHVLLLTVHHIASDGWSMEILTHELAALYGAFVEGKPSPLPELPLQYADYAVWQRRWLRGEALETRLAHWRERLAGAATLELPGDRPRPEVRSLRGGQVPMSVDRDTARDVQALFRRGGATLFMGVLAAFQALLYRLTGEEDVVVGVPAANRDRKEIEGLIGFFVNMLPLRTRLSGSLPFTELLSRVREVALDAYTHGELPFERLVEEIHPERDPGRNPLFQVALQVVPSPSPTVVRDVVLLPLDLPVETARFDLNLAFVEAEEIRGALEYSSDLFDRSTAARLASQLLTLLAGVAADPGQRLDALPLLTPGERRQLLLEWNDTASSIPRDACVQDLFARAVSRAPEAVAVMFEEDRLTYAELDRRANGLARHLRELGVGPDVLAGVCLDRSPDLVVALLGILKAGGAYLPLDPSYPPERLAFMLEDAAAPVLITSESLRDRLPAHGAAVVCLDSLDLEAGEPVIHGATPDNLAYVIYTSGSTGQPKGVAVPHRAIVRLVLGADYVQLEPSDRVAQASNSSFDAATWEIWGALLNGACLVGVTRDVALEPRELAAELRDRGITALFLTTALFNQLAREVPDAFAPLRHLLFGGEAVDPVWVRQVLRHGPPERLLHVYGPTESTTFTSWYQVAEIPEGARTVPIGGPIANTRIVLLDRGFEPVPIGIVGEVLIGGEGLARGYLGRPELTAERFVPDPSGRGERLYRTGDLARRRPDGPIEFVGRTDHQVKVRGFRIEPGEIQAVLDTHPGVRESFVVAREDAGDRRLVAYVVPRTEAPGASELRDFLRERLPDYMVPSVFVSLDALPLTPNNKIDRGALPAPVLADAAGLAGEETIAPRTPTEELLLAIWEDLFAGQGIGIRDDFFALGGHSLLAVQLISRVREACAVEVPLRSLFERPTVEGLAEEVERALRAGGELEMPPLLPASRDEILPLSFAQQRLWILDQMEVGLSAYNVPMALRLEGDLDVEALRLSLEAIVHRHEALRTGFEWMDGNPVQAIFPPETLVLPGVDLRGLPDAERTAEVARLARKEAVAPFDLEVDRLYRVTLLVLGPREHVLLVTLHHIISDGWSMGVLLKEISALYTAFRDGRPSPLASLPVQYADFAVWQRRWMSGETLDRQLAFWRMALADLPTLELPTDRPHRSVHTFAGGGRATVLPRRISESLAALCRSEKVTPFMALLAASQTLLLRATGQARVTVGSPIANRNRVEVEDLIGFFVNTLVLSTDLAGDPTGREALRRVREVTLGAFAHQDMPFQKLVEELQPQRSLQRSPLFQVFFALQNTPRPAAELPGLVLSTLPVDTGTAKFELSFGFADTEAGLQATVEYNRDLFDGTTADRMLGHLENVLTGLVESPEATLSALPLLSAPESQQLVTEWNDTRGGNIGGIEGSVIHRLFEQGAEASPDSVALLAGEERISYGQLNRRANRLARHLRRLGVGPEVPVGVYLDSSLDLILAYLAVLKAGGVYVPLGTAYPPDRLAFMLEETGAPVVLTRRGFTDVVSGPSIVPLEIDADPEIFANESEENLPDAVPGHGLAYIIYTSGSTGLPKGVACSHEGVVRLVRESRFADFAGEVFLQITATTFDVSTFEIWGALLNGGRLAFLTTPTPGLEEIGEAIARHGVTTLWLSSGLFGLMVDRRLEDLRPVRQLLAGGDVVPVPQARRVFEELPGCRLINGYGPTENTTFTACHTVTPGDVYRPSIPIGRPIGNSTTYVLDGQLRPAAAGVRGELYAGGLGVARGYFGRPDLTAERFVPDPFSEVPGARLYRTGDLARWLADGTIEFFGRRDTQVKIRGFRIEPGEVETALGRHPAVAEAVVIAREDRPGHRRLVAYVVAREAQPETADLQAFLRRSLPDYMVPSVFVALDALPLTTNGKVNRAALPAPEDVARESQASFVPPRTEMEEKIAAVWREVLGVPRVGVHDNFFDLGGHSLLLLQAVSRLSEVLGRDLPKGRMFEHPTVAALARVLAEEGSAEPAALSGPSGLALEQSQDRATARRESIRQRRRAPVRETVPGDAFDPFDDDEDDE